MIIYIASSLLRPDGVRKGGYAAEASDLGLKPGQWPTEVRTKTQVFLMEKYEFSYDHDLQSVIYISKKNERLTVFND